MQRDHEGMPRESNAGRHPGVRERHPQPRRAFLGPFRDREAVDTSQRAQSYLLQGKSFGLQELHCR